MKFKDFFSLGNLLAGFAAVIALLEIEPAERAFTWACIFIYVGYVFDLLDGPVARLTKQHDTFGGIFDSVCDYITNSVAPSFIIYHFYSHVAGFPWYIGAFVGAFPITFGTIRQAKQQDRPLSYPCYWFGIPRPVLTVFILALLNSSIFALGIAQASPWRELVYGVGALLIILMSVLHLSKIPFVNHHGRRWMGVLRFGMHSFLTAVPIAFLFVWLILGRPALVYDIILFDLLVYLLLAWTQIPREDIRRMRHLVETGELIEPLVHKNSSWRPRTGAPYFLEDEPELRATTTPARDA